MIFNPLHQHLRVLCCTAFCVLFFLLLPAQAKAAQIVYLASSNQPSPTRDQVETAARFYGLSFLPQVLASAPDSAAVWQAIANSSTVAVVVDADALPLIPRQTLLAATQRGSRSLPVMIAGVNASTDESRLAQWSSGAVQGSQSTPVKAPVSEQIGNVPKVTRQLQGSTLPLGSHPPNYLVLSPGPPLGNPRRRPIRRSSSTHFRARHRHWSRTVSCLGDSTLPRRTQPRSLPPASHLRLDRRAHDVSPLCGRRPRLA